MSVGLLIVRVVVGTLFFAHGAQKVLGWFGGYGRGGTGGWLESLGYRPGVAMAVLAGTAEMMGGLSLATGFLTPLGAAALIGVMVNAIGSVHIRKGPWVTEGGWEYALTMIAVASALSFTGAGRYSIDAALDLGMSGLFWGVMAMTLGTVSGFVLLSTRAVTPAADETERARRAA